jgi:uncharacterized protein YjbJ (UPF0337 family)
MSNDVLKGKWKEISGKVKQKWGKLTDDDILTVNGSAEELSGKLQKHYGYKKDEAQKHINDFLKEHDDN